MAIETFADIGLVRFSWGTRPVGAGFIVDDRHIVTCAHVVNASLGRALIAAERPDTVGPVAVRPLTGHSPRGHVGGCRRARWQPDRGQRRRGCEGAQLA